MSTTPKFVYLQPDDYSINQYGELCNNLTSGLSFIFFYTVNCAYCKDLQPAFVKMERSIEGCAFGFMNVDQANMSIVRMSESSTMPLTYVPLIVLYYNGRPIANFVADESDPNKNFANMHAFLMHYSDRIRRATANATTTSNAGYGGTGGNSRYGQAGSSSTGALSAPVAAGSAIPEYSTGVPSASASSRGRKVCYLNFDSAYGGKSSGAQPRAR